MVSMPDEESVVMSKVRAGIEDGAGVVGLLMVVRDLVRELPFVAPMEEVDLGESTDLIVGLQIRSLAVGGSSSVGFSRLNSSSSRKSMAYEWPVVWVLSQDGATAVVDCTNTATRYGCRCRIGIWLMLSVS